MQESIDILWADCFYYLCKYMKDNKLNLKKKFDALLKEKDLTVRGFCKEIGMSSTNLYDIYKRNSIDTKYLDIINEKYDVPPSYFVIEEEMMGYQLKQNINKEEDLKKNYLDEIEHLKKELESKQKEIELLRELVDSKNEVIRTMKGSN